MVQWVRWEQVLDSAALFGWWVLLTAHVALAAAATASVSRSRLLDERAKAWWVLLAWVFPLVAALWFVAGRAVLGRRAERTESEPVSRG
jgi:hypothetical protein